MSTSSGQRKVAAKCRNCGSIFVSEIDREGTVRPIGTRQGCPCGEGDFRPFG